MNVARIRGFLLQHPKPAAVRVSGEGEPETLKPGKSYARCAETIAALNVDLVECLDASGNILRALRMGEADAQRSAAAEVPPVLATDPHAAMLTHFANLLHRAYEHSTEIAFGKMVDLVERIGDRAEAIESRLERAEAANRRLFNEQLEDAFERAHEAAEKANGENGDLTQQMVGAFLSGKMSSPAAPKTNGKG